MTEIRCRVAEVVIFRFGSPQVEYLVLRREENDPVYPGTWQIVTGSIDGGEPAFAAGRREVQEETALPIERFWAVPHSSVFYSTRRDEMQLTAFFAAQVSASAPVVLSAEHCESAWLTYAEARKRLVWPGQRQGLDIVHEFIVRGEEVMTLSEIHS